MWLCVGSLWDIGMGVQSAEVQSSDSFSGQPVLQSSAVLHFSHGIYLLLSCDLLKCCWVISVSHPGPTNPTRVVTVLENKVIPLKHIPPQLLMGVS